LKDYSTKQLIQKLSIPSLNNLLSKLRELAKPTGDQAAVNDEVFAPTAISTSVENIAGYVS